VVELGTQLGFWWCGRFPYSSLDTSNSSPLLITTANDAVVLLLLAPCAYPLSIYLTTCPSASIYMPAWLAG